MIAVFGANKSQIKELKQINDVEVMDSYRDLKVSLLFADMQECLGVFVRKDYVRTAISFLRESFEDEDLKGMFLFTDSVKTDCVRCIGKFK